VRPNAAYLAAGEQAHDVDLVRGLVEHHAAAGLRAELLGPPWAIEEVGEVERGDHAQRAVVAAPDQLARPEDRPVETVAVPDDQLHAVLARGVIHRAAI